MGKLLSVGSDNTPSPNGISLVPVSARQSLAKLDHSADWDGAAQKVQRTSASSLGCHARRLGLAAVYVAIPLAVVFLTIFSWLDWWRMEYMHPEVDQVSRLGRVVAVAIESDLPAEDIDQVRFLIAAKYRDIYDSPGIWRSSYTRTQVGFYGRPHIVEAMKRFDSQTGKFDQNRIREAEATVERLVDTIRSRGKAGSAYLFDTEVITEDPIMAFATITPLFMMVFWLPSLIMAALFKRGLLLRLFGLQVVDSQGNPASRWRAIWRVFVQGVLVVPVFLVWYFYRSYGYFFAHYIASVALAIALAWLVYLSVRHPHRNLADRIAGTYLAVE